MKESKNSILMCCKKCGIPFTEYMLCGNKESIVLQNIRQKCTRCKRVMILKKYTEGGLLQHSVNGRVEI